MADGRFGKLSRARAPHEFSVSRVSFPKRRKRNTYLARVVSSLSKIEAPSTHMTSMRAARCKVLKTGLLVPLPAV